MRQDMFKVIVERPRRGVGFYRHLPNAYRAAKHFILDEDGEVTDDFTGRTPMRTKLFGDQKSLNENLNPLRRFLYSKIGSPWNEVFSEICAELDVNSTIKKHVRDHVPDYVEVSTFIEDGEIYYTSRYSGDRHISHCGGLYVHPTTGILHDAYAEYGDWREWNRIKREERAAEAWKTKREINADLTFEKEKGVWFKVTRVVEEKRVWTWTDGRYHVTDRWMKETSYRKNTANKKEIRDYGLNAA